MFYDHENDPEWGNIPEEAEYSSSDLTYDQYIELQKASGFAVLEDYEFMNAKLPKWYLRTQKDIQNLDSYIPTNWWNCR